MDNSVLNKTIGVLQRVDWGLEGDYPDYDMFITVEGKSESEFWDLDPVRLKEEIETNFLKSEDSKTQDRYAAYLIHCLRENFIPVVGIVKRELEKCKRDILSPYGFTAADGNVQEENFKKITTSAEFLTGEFYTRMRAFLSDMDEDTKESFEWHGHFNMLYGQVNNMVDDIAQLLRLFSPSLYQPFWMEYKDYKDFNFYTYPSSEAMFLANTPQATLQNTQLQWKGDKTDLAELVWALFKSGRITDTSTGQIVTQKVLADQIKTLLSVDPLDIVNLMKGRYGTPSKNGTYKARDGKNFVNELQSLIDGRILD